MFTVLVVLLLVAGCVSRSRPALSVPQVVDSEVLDADDWTLLSPDGARLARRSAVYPCVTALDGSDERCVVDEAGVDLGFADWSPDNTKLTFTNDDWAGYEPDVWTFDVLTGVSRNLTDDGEDVLVVEGPPNGAYYDTLPSWSPDGESILFARSRDPLEPMSLVRMPATGGEVTVLREIPCSYSEIAALAWSAEHVAWTCGLESPWVSLGEHTGDRADMVIAGDEDEDRMLLSFSPDGKWLLADSLYDSVHYLDRRVGPLVASTDGGNTTRVAASGDAAFPTWSPEGHSLAYVMPPNAIYVVDEPGGRPQVLHASRNVWAPDGLRLNWAPGKLLHYTRGASLTVDIESSIQLVLLTLDR